MPVFSELEALNFPLTSDFGVKLAKCALGLPLDGWWLKLKKTIIGLGSQIGGDGELALLGQDEIWADWWKHFHRKFQLKQ